MGLYQSMPKNKDTNIKQHFQTGLHKIKKLSSIVRQKNGSKSCSTTDKKMSTEPKSPSKHRLKSFDDRKKVKILTIELEYHAHSPITVKNAPSFNTIKDEPSVQYPSQSGSLDTLGCFGNSPLGFSDTKPSFSYSNLYSPLTDSLVAIRSSFNLLESESRESLFLKDSRRQRKTEYKSMIRKKLLLEALRRHKDTHMSGGAENREWRRLSNGYCSMRSSRSIMDQNQCTNAQKSEKNVLCRLRAYSQAAGGHVKNLLFARPKVREFNGPPQNRNSIQELLKKDEATVQKRDSELDPATKGKSCQETGGKVLLPFSTAFANVIEIQNHLVYCGSQSAVDLRSLLTIPLVTTSTPSVEK